MTPIALTGIGVLITNRASISGLPDAFNFSFQVFLGVPTLLRMVILVATPACVVLQHSRWGRYLFAIGSNPEAAQLTGANLLNINAFWQRIITRGLIITVVYFDGLRRH